MEQLALFIETEVNIFPDTEFEYVYWNEIPENFYEATA